MLKREKRVQQPKEIYCATGKIGTKEAEEIHRIDLLTGKKTLIFKKK